MQASNNIYLFVVNCSKGNEIEMKAERSFDLDFVFDIEAKWTCLFQNL